jgi:segregation and condensation protein B
MSEMTEFRSQDKLINIIEAILFTAPIAVTPTQIATALDVSVREIEQRLETLKSLYSNRGLRLQWHQGKVKMTTAPETASQVEHFLGLEATSRLSQAALETLAIIAYQQPVTRPEVDGIRGVNSDSVVRGLLQKGLVEEAGRAERPGRPFLYITTPDFLSHFGLASLDDLPPLPEPPLSGENIQHSDTLKG